MRRFVALVTLLFAVVGQLPPAGGSARASSASWIEQGSHPGRLLSAIASYSEKLPIEFEERLQYAREDGTLIVMVALDRRNERLESRMQAIVPDLKWYGDGPRFYGSVDQLGFERLLRHEAVEFVEPDHPVSLLLATSVPDISGRGPGAPWQFIPGEGLGAIESSVAGLDEGAVTGKGVTVAVIDSGIDKTHRDFGGWDCEPRPYQPCESRVVKAVALPALRGGPDPGDSLPTTDLASGHGTHVAGIVAGNGYYARDGENAEALYGGDGHSIGVAPQASLISVKLGDGLSAALATEGLQWTLTNAEEYGIRVANNSWGCARGCAYNANSVVAQILEELYHEGVVSVFAAGNGGGTGGGGEFSGYSQSPYVISVASYDHITDQLSGFSSRGEMGSSLVDPATWTPQNEASVPPRRPDIAAPGEYINSAASLTGGAASLIPRVDPKDAGAEPGFLAYTFMSGTSMSAPHVSGAAATLLSACPRSRPLHIMRALMVGAERSKISKSEGDTQGVAEPFEVGYGGLNVGASLRWLMDGPCSGRFGRIEGKVQAKDLGLSAAGASVVCAEGLSATTDERENFMIEDVPIGEHICTASRKGFVNATQTISVLPYETTEALFKLKEKKRRR